MPTLLHISDLHRTSGPRIGNDELLAAITSDAMRWRGEGIPNPDLIVVSGDIVQGVSIGTSDPDSEIAAQYSEACDFLRRLAAEFVDSDRSRVVIIPGNHDVDWSRARNAMEPLADCPNEISSKAFESSSNVRWDWKEQKAYKISNSDQYESRFKHFRQFQAEFYSGLDPSPLSHSDGDLVFAEYPSLGLVIVGFASWHGNDCFCHVGEIDSASPGLITGTTCGLECPGCCCRVAPQHCRRTTSKQLYGPTCHPQTYRFRIQRRATWTSAFPWCGTV